MRDLGLMGESTFSLWCGDAGLVPNGSQIDKTGWDFFVEFPFDSSPNPAEIHKPACECKVQVKATDKNDRKLSITLSNLRRLITAQMPAFFVFIEFDGKEIAQNAFIVHVDNELISKVLKRLHEIEQSVKENNFNKRTMTIHYESSNKLSGLNGASLKKALLKYIGEDLAEYISNKKSHLESTGFEDGFAQMNFTTKGEENLKDLINVSLGLKRNVEISRFTGINKRFGILSKSPFVDSFSGRLEMPNIKPNSEGYIKFKEEKLAPGISFKSKIFLSPFNLMVPENLRKIRVEGDFFDLQFNPHTGSANYSFSLGEGVRLDVRQFKDALTLLSLISSSGKKIYAELNFEGFPLLEFGVGCADQEFNLVRELKAIESAVKLISDFNISEVVDISFNEISTYENEINQLYEIISSPTKLFKVEFGVDGEGFDPSGNVACIFLVTAPIGSHIFGVIIVLTGNVESIEEDQFRLLTKEAIIEKRITSERDKTISNEDLVSLIETIEEKYDDDYSVVTMFDKKK